jgi:acyl carrier protein
MDVAVSSFHEVAFVVTKTLGIEDRAGRLSPTTPLLDSIPEFDSQAVLDVILALEQHFGVTIDNDEVTGELFETLGTLAALIERKRAPGRTFA